MKRSELKEWYAKYYSGTLLKEQDELFGDEGGDEEEDAAGDEGGDEGAEDTADDEAADDAGDTEPEEEEVEIEAGDEARLNQPFEAQIDAVLADYEMEALKSAKINKPGEIESDVALESKWWRKSLGVLLEQEEAVVTTRDLDIDKFASDVARFIKNYDTLIDMETILYNKAKELLGKYGDEVVLAFEEILQTRHDIYLDEPTHGMAHGSHEEQIEPPLAIGTPGAGGGAA